MQRRRFVKGMSAVAAGSAAMVAAPGLANAGSWKFVTREAGVTVTTRKEGDRQFPTFRGTGRVKASVWEILAVLEDADNHTKWLHDCNGAGLLKKVNDTTRIIYSRVKAPWPVKDRDVVLRATLDVITPAKEVKSRFRAIKSGLKKPVDGVVRMPILEGHWYLVAMDANKTLAEYQVNADPGGQLPDWVVESSSKDLPLHSIRNLRARVAITRAQNKYADFIAEMEKRYGKYEG